jgi:hypothetical protein
MEDSETLTKVTKASDDGGARGKVMHIRVRDWVRTQRNQIWYGGKLSAESMEPEKLPRSSIPTSESIEWEESGRRIRRSR